MVDSTEIQTKVANPACRLYPDSPSIFFKIEFFKIEFFKIGFFVPK